MSAISDALRTLLRRCETDPSAAPALHRFAVAAAAEGRIDEACTALYWYSTVLASEGRHGEALAAIERAERLARGARLTLAAEAAFFRAVVHKERGDHDASCQALIALLSDRRFGRLPLVRRMDTLNQLAALCVFAQDADAALSCWAMARHECHRDGVAMTGLFRVQHSISRLALSVFGHPPLDAMLPGPGERGLPAAQRAGLLGDAIADLEDALGRPDRSMVGTIVTLAQIALAVARAVRDGSAAAAVEARRLYDAADRRNPDLELECRVLVMTGLIAAGVWDQAQRLVASAPAPAAADRAPYEALRWLYLESEVSRAAGRMELALQQYQHYAAAAGSRLPRMNLRVHELLLRLTQAPGARPSDQPQRVPGYLERARRLLAHGEGLVTVGAVAEAVGVSERTLREAFGVFEGISPKQYQARCRLDAVMQFLGNEASQALSVADVAERFGFSHPGRFAREFRERFGVTVADARRQAAMLQPPAPARARQA